MKLEEVTKQMNTRAKQSSQEVRDCTKFKPLSVMRQGDVYIMKLGNEEDLKGLEEEIQKEGGAWEDFSLRL